jgi:flagellar hook-associated protein 1 FlgK
MSDFITLYTAFSGLSAAQAAMETTSNNIANASTVGYTRQRVDLVSRTPYARRYGIVGQGVDIAGITRARVTGLDAQVRLSASAQGRLDVLADMLAHTEAVMGEPDAGITSTMTGLWNALDELTLDPPNTTAREHVISALGDLAGRINSVAEKWQIEETTASNSLESYVDKTNAMLQEVADLNKQILDARALPGEPNDLLDQRDLLIDELSNIAGVTAFTTDNGAMRVSINGLSLVTDTVVTPLSYNASTFEITHSSGGTVVPGGELAGFQSYLTTELPGFFDELNTFASDLADALNAQHSAGYTPGGAAGGDLLTYTVGKEALTLSVAVSNQSEIAAAGSGPPVADFDGVNAEALSNLRQLLTADGGTATLDDAIRSVISYVGEMTAAAASGAKSQAALTTAAENARLQAHGVSIDEEMVNLITYQRAYEAAARVMTAVDQNLDTLINKTGIVGR